MPVEIMPSLFLSDARRAHDVSRLKSLGITHVVNVAGKSAEGPAEEYCAAGINVLNVDADDEEGYPMLEKHLSEVHAFVNETRTGTYSGRVVVHCVAGINRSGVILAAILMLDKKLSVLEAVAHCRLARGNCFLWNGSFQTQLVALARSEGLLGPAPGRGNYFLTGREPTPKITNVTPKS